MIRASTPFVHVALVLLLLGSARTAAAGVEYQQIDLTIYGMD